MNNARKNLLFANGFAFVLMVAMNYLSNAGLLNGNRMKTISDRYFNYFTPAGFAFSIWGFIYFTPAGFAFSDRYFNYFTPAGFAFSIWGFIYLGLFAFVLYTWLKGKEDPCRLNAVI